jgi:hypothetical protein
MEQINNPFSNLGSMVLLGAVVGSVGAEIVAPHAYGLHLFQSTYMTLDDGSRIHIHHWVWALMGMGLYAIRPFTTRWLNSMVVGVLLGIFAQGVSYSTSHLMLYDPDGFRDYRAETLGGEAHG